MENGCHLYRAFCCVLLTDGRVWWPDDRRTKADCKFLVVTTQNFPVPMSHVTGSVAVPVESSLSSVHVQTVKAVDADVGFWYPSNRLQLWQWQLPCQPPHEWCWNDRVQCLYLNQSEFFSGVLFRFVVFGGVCVTVDLKKINFLRWHYTHRRAQFSGSL